MTMTKKEQRQLDLSVIELIEKGEATVDSLTSNCEVNEKAIKAAFNRIEGRDKYVIFDDTGVITFVDGETFDEMEAEIAKKKAAEAKVKKITKPQATMLRLKKAVMAKTTAFTKWQDKAVKAAGNLPYGDKIRFQIASLQLTLATHELNELKNTLVQQFNLKSVEELDQYEDLDDLLSDDNGNDDE